MSDSSVFPIFPVWIATNVIVPLSLSIVFVVSFSVDSEASLFVLLSTLSAVALFFEESLDVESDDADSADDAFDELPFDEFVDALFELPLDDPFELPFDDTFELPFDDPFELPFDDPFELPPDGCCSCVFSVTFTVRVADVLVYCLRDAVTVIVAVPG
jgi:hypothetical protein